MGKDQKEKKEELKQEEKTENTEMNSAADKTQSPQEDLPEDNQEAQEAEEESEEEKKLKELELKCSDYLDKYQRCLAEFDNYRKRTTKEKASMYDDGVRDTIEKMLPVIDNLERAVAAQEGKTEEDDPLYKGVKMIVKQFQEIFSGMEVEAIAAVGEKFDPNLHAAVAHEENEEYGENEIILEMLKGYKYKDKVIRPSMVKVAN